MLNKVARVEHVNILTFDADCAFFFSNVLLTKETKWGLKVDAQLIHHWAEVVTKLNWQVYLGNFRPLVSVWTNICCSHYMVCCMVVLKLLWRSHYMIDRVTCYMIWWLGHPGTLWSINSCFAFFPIKDYTGNDAKPHEKKEPLENGPREEMI